MGTLLTTAANTILPRLAGQSDEEKWTSLAKAHPAYALSWMMLAKANPTPEQLQKAAIFVPHTLRLHWLLNQAEGINIAANSEPKNKTVVTTAVSFRETDQTEAPETEIESLEAEMATEAILDINDPQPLPIEVPEEAPIEIPEEAQKEVPEEAPPEIPEEAQKEVPEEAPIEVPIEEPQEAPTEIPEEAPIEVPIEEPQEAPIEISKEAPIEIPAEAPTEVPETAPLESPTITAEVAPTTLAESPMSLSSMAHEFPADTQLFTPFHLVDYFASQGIKLDLNDIPKTSFDKKLMTFTQWLKTMKKVNFEAQAALATADPAVDAQARASLFREQVITETMANVLAQQGKKAQATQVYLKLILLHPEKTALFAARIHDLNK